VVDENGQFLKDDQGAILMPRLDSQGLRAFALEVDGSYRQARLDDNDLRGLGLLDGPRHVRNNGQTLRLDTWADQGYWLLLPLLLLAACAGRRGWLLCLPLLFMLPQPGYAMSFTDLWLRPDQQGQRLLEQKKPLQAVEHFEDSQWQGYALYQAGDYAAAARRFAEANTASAHFNRGNALAMSGELEAAIDAYEQALELQPDLQAAAQNKTLVEQVLEQKRAAATPPDDKTPETASQPPPTPPVSTSNSSATGDAAQQQENSSATEPDAAANNNDSLEPPPAADNAQPGNEPADGPTTPPPAQTSDHLDEEHRQALEQWLRQIPDNPSELLRRKFWYEQQQHQDSPQ